MTDWLINREEDRTMVAEDNGHMCAGKKGTDAAPQRKEREGDGGGDAEMD